MSKNKANYNMSVQKCEISTFQKRFDFPFLFYFIFFRFRAFLVTFLDSSLSFPQAPSSGPSRTSSAAGRCRGTTTTRRAASRTGAA